MDLLRHLGIARVRMLMAVLVHLSVMLGRWREHELGLKRLHLLALPTAHLQGQILDEAQRLTALMAHQTHRRILHDLV